MMAKPKAALRLMSISNTKLYEMIKTCELETFKRGGSRYIPVAAISDYTARSRAAKGALERNAKSCVSGPNLPRQLGTGDGTLLSKWRADGVRPIS